MAAKKLKIDPWLRGPQSDVASWFSRQWHTTISSVQSINELEDCLFEVEHMAHTHVSRSMNKKPSTFDRSKMRFVDAVVLVCLILSLLAYI